MANQPSMNLAVVVKTTSQKNGNFSEFERNMVVGARRVGFSILQTPHPLEHQHWRNRLKGLQSKSQKESIYFCWASADYKCTVTIEQMVESMCRLMQESFPVCLKSLGQNESGKYLSSICLTADLFIKNIKVDRSTSSDWTFPSPSGSLPHLSKKFLYVISAWDFTLYFKCNPPIPTIFSLSFLFRHVIQPCCFTSEVLRYL